MSGENLINQKIVDYLLDLSRLQISEKEKEKIEKDLNLILDYVKQLQEINTGGIDLEKILFQTKNSDNKEVDDDLLFVRDDLLDGFYQRKDNWLEIPPIF
ncbi:MAG: hypothetical protein N2692_00780 [Patescibacteria group bacterium]|jgi:aspartyl/glutamyl-tRNA(Asn/Gln) amidotransferase C subunit|nr:hypothetical protein [Patescibacteria group bacterium]